MKYKIINNINRTAKYAKNNENRKFLNCNSFENVRFFNSNITYFHFKNITLKNVDFLGCNLKHSILKNGQFINCVFYNVNLSNSNFKNSNFKNCYFINCNFHDVKKINFSRINVINSDFSTLHISKMLESTALNLNRVPAFKKAYVFTTKRSKGLKLNKGMFFVLRNDFSDYELSRVLSVINNKSNSHIKNFITYGQFYEFGKKYLKK